MKIAKLILCIFILVGVTNCENDHVLSDDERAFKIEATSLSNLLNQFLNIGMDAKSEKLPNDQGIVYTYDTEERERYLEKTKDKWLNINKNLYEMSKKFPNSKWSDDAAFCRAIEFVFVMTPQRLFHNHKIESIRKFLTSHSTFRIEKWTKTQFSKLYETFFHGMPFHLADRLSEARIVRMKLYHILIIQYCLVFDFKNAEKEKDNLESEGVDNFFIEEANAIIGHYKTEQNGDLRSRPK